MHTAGADSAHLEGGQWRSLAACEHEYLGGGSLVAVGQQGRGREGPEAEQHAAAAWACEEGR